MACEGQLGRPGRVREGAVGPNEQLRGQGRGPRVRILSQGQRVGCADGTHGDVPQGGGPQGRRPDGGKWRERVLEAADPS